MSKICPKCRREQEDPSHLGCEKCRVPFVKATELVTSFTRDELKVIAGFLLKDWRVYVVAGFFLLIGIGLLYWKGREHIKAQIGQFQVTVSNQVVTAYSTATNQLASQFKNFATDASNQVVQAYSSVTNQIAEEFQTPRIKQTVETVAKDEAKSILEAEVQPAVNSFKEDALFARTIARAQGYDFKAYQALLKIGKGTNENAKLANQVLDELDRSLARDRSEFTPQRKFIVVHKNNIYEGPFTSDELAAQFKNIANDKTTFNREGFVNTVNDLKQPLFLGSLITLFVDETDLGVADRLTIAISTIAKKDFGPRGFEQILAWWTVHQPEYTNWPIAIFERGMEEFNSGRYQQAVDSFSKVLEIDSTADVSRAHAVACCWEAGQTNRALQLTKEFKNPSARWAQWANAKGDLDSGNISNATVLFYSISTNFPAISRLPDRNSHIFRKIDWKLFDQLCGAKTP